MIKKLINYLYFKYVYQPKPLQEQCDHEYEIAMIMGLGFNSYRMPATAADGAEVICYCNKCRKTFASVVMDSRGNVRKKLNNV